MSDCHEKFERISLVEEFILNETALPPYMRSAKRHLGWRAYRMEYGFECGCPEGRIWLPPWVDSEKFEAYLNRVCRGRIYSERCRKEMRK